MITAITVRNVHQAIPEGCHQLRERAVVRGSRNGDVKVVPGPFITEYTDPIERVELHAERDANPFFHLMEALWMLDGRDDVAWLSEFNSQIHQYSDDGKTFNGAYGQRWRHRFGLCQIKRIGNALYLNPEDRRQVMSMWDPRTDLTHQETKDVPCNLQAIFGTAPDGRVTMSVTNRSNDIIWGAYGANAVHFSVLLEAVACVAARPMGSYCQVSNNTHAYTRHWDLVDTLADKAPMPPAEHWSPYDNGQVEATKVFNVSFPEWETDLGLFMNESNVEFADPFFQRTAKPMREAWRLFKSDSADRHGEALGHLAAEMDPASDWMVAAVAWLTRRLEKSNASS